MAVFVFDASIWMFLFFLVFLIVGYDSEKPSGGFFMLFSGLALIGLGVLIRDDLLYINGLTTPFGVLIMYLGAVKAFFEVEEIKTPEGKRIKQWRRRR